MKYHHWVDADDPQRQAPLAKTINAAVISRNGALRGYKNFDSDAAKEFILSRRSRVPGGGGTGIDQRQRRA
jgi:hypothetical protein